MVRVWRAADLAADTSWHTPWSGDELASLHAWAEQTSADALAAEPRLIQDLLADAPAALVERANAVRAQLIDGAGLVLLSGFEVDSHSQELAAVAFLLFSSLLGSLRSQNAAGHLLGHVTDIGVDANDPTTRIYQTNNRQTFHTDSTDAVGLLCLRAAERGGASMVVNVEAVYERMMSEEPALAERLFDPIATDRRGEQPMGELPWFEIPVLSRSVDHRGDQRITGLYQRQYIDSTARFDDAPRPDEEQVRALDLFDELMNDPTMHFQMSFAPGDMQFVHNHSLLHDRTGFTDHADPALRRHLLRVWVSLPGDRELPESFGQRYGSITVGDRGGIMVRGTEPTISFSP